MNKTITNFLQEQTCATLCCVDEQGKPWCFSCFYVFNQQDGLLYFKSGAESHHSGLIKASPNIAGTILPDKLNTLLVKGIQLEGVVLDADDPIAVKAAIHYHKKHPLALAMPGEIWTILINHIKMTDSTLGFGKKIEWSRGVGDTIYDV